MRNEIRSCRNHICIGKVAAQSTCVKTNINEVQVTKINRPLTWNTYYRHTARKILFEGTNFVARFPYHYHRNIGEVIGIIKQSISINRDNSYPIPSTLEKVIKPLTGILTNNPRGTFRTIAARSQIPSTLTAAINQR